MNQGARISFHKVDKNKISATCKLGEKLKKLEKHATCYMRSCGCWCHNIQKNGTQEK